MNEFAVTLDDGRIMTVYAYTQADIPEVLEAEHGMGRDAIVSIRYVRPATHHGTLPYLESPLMYL